MNIKKALAGIGILGAICGLVTGVTDWKKADKEENNEAEEIPNDDVVYMELEKNEKEETTTEE